MLIVVYCCNAERYESSQQEGRWYFFTDRTRKYRGGNRPARSTPSGFWKLTGLKTEIEHNGKKMGVRNTLNFYWGLQQGENSRTEWMMREYSIKEFQIPKEPAGLEPHMKLDDAVLCMVYRNLNENAGRKRQNPSVHPQQSIQSPEQIENLSSGTLQSLFC
ncbi:NAC domain-containing protein 67-like [Asparagus officinalis]|uniref:NAC domain-containing protein 67-like n=1 Tax=Asparagus officinalis TaxID=4686 RepID=UPI00098E3B34|nr:NAC domain-containing protein 67-like [Asparagus officinalis]